MSFRVIVFTNGMVMAFDPQGRQVPELQGPWSRVARALFDAGVREVEMAVWDRGTGHTFAHLRLVPQTGDLLLPLLAPIEPVEGGVRR